MAVLPGAATANLGDRVFKWTTAAFAVLVLVVLAGLAVQMARASWQSIERFGFDFLTGTNWDPVKEQFGALPFIWGTLVSSFIALLIAVPVALGVGIFLSHLAPAWLARPLGFIVELLAAVPSVVYGLWGVFVLAPWLRETVEPFLGDVFGFLPFFQGNQVGVGMLAGGVILAIMILPTIAAVTREVLRAVPGTYHEGTLALGATRWQAIRTGVLPYARSGIVGAILLGLGRALGETMAVTMVIGNRPEIDVSVFAPASTMASVIANEYTEATSDLYLSSLSQVGLLLFVVTLLLNIAARLLVSRVGRMPRGAARAA